MFMYKKIIYAYIYVKIARANGPVTAVDVRNLLVRLVYISFQMCA